MCPMKESKEEEWKARTIQDKTAVLGSPGQTQGRSTSDGVEVAMYLSLLVSLNLHVNILS